MNCRLIAFDLDGTLLDNDKHIPEENLLALHEAAERGVILAPATGRILRGIPSELRELPFLRYYILSNGAAVYDAAEERTLYRDISLDLTLETMDFLDTLPVLYDCYQNDVGWMSQETFEKAPPYFIHEPHMMGMIEKLRVRVPDLKKTLREHNEPVQKISIFFRPEDNERRLWYLRHFSELFPELLASSSISNNIELNSVRAGKGNGLLALCKALDIAPEDSMSFGDESNDLSMLRAAGRGVAMGNASKDVKAAADAVCETNTESGVAKEIRRVLGKE